VKCVVGIIQLKSIGQILFDAVVHKLQLVESDYFDLEYTNHESIPVSQFTFSAVMCDYLHTHVSLTLSLSMILFNTVSPCSCETGEGTMMKEEEWRESTFHVMRGNWCRE